MPPEKAPMPSYTPTWVHDKLNELERDKSDKAVVKSEIRRMEARMDAVAAAAEKVHCQREGEFASVQGKLTKIEEDVECHTEEIRGAYKWILRGLAAVVLFLVTVAGGFVWYLAGMSFALKAHGEAIQRIEQRIQVAPQIDLAPLQALMKATASQAAAEALRKNKGTSSSPSLPTP